MTSIRTLAVLRPPQRPTGPAEVVADAGWRGVCEMPGRTPAEMAIDAGRSAFTASADDPRDMRWVVHAGVGPQAIQGWPIHHNIQHGIVGSHGNAIEVKQNCAGGLTSWLLAAAMLGDDGFSICTGADNWSWTDRFAISKTIGGEPFSDVSSAVIIGRGAGVVKLLGSATASFPSLADDWRGPRAYWESITASDFHSAYTDATIAQSPVASRDSKRMIVRAVRGALADAKVSPQYVTHFVPQGSGWGQPFRSIASVVGLPWSEELHEYSISLGYLGVSTHADGLLHLAETNCLREDSIVLLLACEYQISATAIVCRITHTPEVVADGAVRVMS